MPNPTRHDIEMAAARYFDTLRADIDQPRNWPPEQYDSELTFNIEMTRKRIEELKDKIRDNDFKGEVELAARQMLEPLSLSLEGLNEQLKFVAKQLAAKAMYQQMAYFHHVLTDPLAPFAPGDPLFATGAQSHAVGMGSTKAIQPVQTIRTAPASGGMVLKEMVKRHVASMVDQAVSESHIIEFERVARWTMEEFGEQAPIASIDTDALREFRDKLRRIDKTKRSHVKDGLKDLDSSLTEQRDDQIASATARKYWSYVKAMFNQAVQDGHLAHDPAALLAVKLRKDEVSRKPPPFMEEELRRLFALPLFTGYQSSARLKNAGNCHTRGGHFWSYVLSAYTGMRGGEVSQLLPEDFVFTDPIPHVLVREENDDGERVKSAKTESSVRATPLANDLMVLGIKQFVEGRRKQDPKQRVFREFPVGTRGKKSDGMSKFWRRYLMEFGLHKPGRALHVWRHTVIYHLRARGVSEEDIRYLVGHSSNTQTARYGTGTLLQRIKDRALANLDYGFDIVAAVGGPFNPKIHGE